MEVAFPAGQRVAIRGVVNGDVLRTVLQGLSQSIFDAVSVTR
jgi:hypothetical protein